MILTNYLQKSCPAIAGIKCLNGATVIPRHIPMGSGDNESAMHVEWLVGGLVRRIDAIPEEGQAQWLSRWYPLVDLLIIQEPFQHQALFVVIHIVFALQHQLLAICD